MTDNIARILSKLQWIRHIRFSCDSTPQIEAIFRAADLLKSHGVKPYKLFVYLLVTDDLENAAHRVDELKKLKGINLYAQAERNVRQGKKDVGISSQALIFIVIFRFMVLVVLVGFALCGAYFFGDPAHHFLFGVFGGFKVELLRFF